MVSSKSKSRVWLYFRKNSEKSATCKICNKELKTSGNTTNLKTHLDRIHKNEIQEHEDDNTAENATATTSTPAKQRKITESFDVIESVPSSSKKFHQQNVKECFENISSASNKDGAKSKKITDAITNFVIMDNKPFSVVEGTGFRKLMKEVAPHYQMPSRETIKNRMEEKYNIQSLMFKDYIQKAESYCLTYDVWTETMQNKSFLGITIHFNDSTRLKSGTLGVIELTQKHTAEYLETELRKFLREWGVSVEKVSAVVTDNDATMMKMNRAIFGEKRIIPCFAHTLNLIVSKSLEHSGDLMELISKVRGIVKFIKRSVNASDELRKRQIEAGCSEGNVKKLILDVKTRWNSAYYMLERFYSLRAVLGQILLARDDAPSMVTGADLRIIRETLKLLLPFETITREISGDNYVTISKTIPLVSCLTEAMEGLTSVEEKVEKLREELKTELRKRFEKIEFNPSMALATALDPRFKTIHFKEPLAKVKVLNYLNNFLIENRVGDNVEDEEEKEKDNGKNSDFDIWKFHRIIANSKSKGMSSSVTQNEVQFYLNSPVAAMKKSPIEVWEELNTVYPSLYPHAKKYLGIVATSVPSERLFSKAGATITQERNRLTGKRLSKLLFLNSIM